MIQLILHLIGDYVTQSDYMANNKRRCSVAAGLHAIVYSLPFLLIFQPSYLAGLTIVLTHFLIDRFGLARHVVYAKNIILCPNQGVGTWPAVMGLLRSEEETMRRQEFDRKWSWENCKATGYPSEAPVWLSVWLTIIADNTLHLLINYAALRWL